MNCHEHTLSGPRAWGVCSGPRGLRVRWSSELCPQPAEEARARSESLASWWTRSFLPSEPGIQNGEGMLASPLSPCCLLYSGSPLCPALSFYNVTNCSLAKCSRVSRCCKQNTWTESCIHNKSGILLASKSKCPNNYLRSNEAYIQHSFPLYPQSFILLQKSTTQ